MLSCLTFKVVLVEFYGWAEIFLQSINCFRLLRNVTIEEVPNTYNICKWLFTLEINNKFMASITCADIYVFNMSNHSKS